MKKFLTVLMILGIALLLCACAGEINGPTPMMTGGTAQNGAEPTEHKHDLMAAADNIVEHEPVVYCGNTMTTVSYKPMTADCIGWEETFDGSLSVELTDFLRFLDYSGDICRCLPEYTVDTEFGTGYGINLEDGYARHEGKQVSLTQEQVTRLKEIMNEIHKEGE